MLAWLFALGCTRPVTLTEHVTIVHVPAGARPEDVSLASGLALESLGALPQGPLTTPAIVFVFPDGRTEVSFRPYRQGPTGSNGAS